MTRRVHVIGAGLSGLAAAVAVAKAGRAVSLHDAARHAGGRCRSFHDHAMGRRIDNGNHLVLSGNRAIARYLEDIGAKAGLSGPERAEFRFLDLASGERWTLRPNAGRIPWWIFRRARRAPATRAWEYLRALRLARAKPSASVRACLDGGGAGFARFWEPLAVSVLNTPAAHASAALLWPVLRETFARGEAACRPRMATEGLSECFVDPALARLAEAGACVRLGHRLRRLVVGSAHGAGRVDALDFAGEDATAVDAGDAVILALPPAAAAALVDGLEAPRSSHAIVNGHFLLARRAEQPDMLGLVGGVCHWLFVRGDIASVTISAADAMAGQANDAIAEGMWRDVAQALGLGRAPLPAYRIVKEKRATFSQTPAEVARRAKTRTGLRNLFLAGDWTDTGLPATLEGSVRSGNTAAAAALETLTTP